MESSSQSSELRTQEEVTCIYLARLEINQKQKQNGRNAGCDQTHVLQKPRRAGMEDGELPLWMEAGSGFLPAPSSHASFVTAGEGRLRGASSETSKAAEEPQRRGCRWSIPGLLAPGSGLCRRATGGTPASPGDLPASWCLAAVSGREHLLCPLRSRGLASSSEPFAQCSR